MRALLLLESSSTQRLLEEYLESRGYVVTLASSVDDAKALACREEQALFLVDRVMVPEGLDVLCRDLRAAVVGVRTVIVALTLSDDAEDLRRLIEAGVDDYVVLPLEHEQLCARLLLAERRSAHRSELRFAAERAHDSEHDLKAIADASPVKLWVLGPDGHATFFNRRYLEYTGRTLAQERGMGWAECLHPEDYSRCLDAFVGALKRREEFRLEYRLRRADGSYSWFLSNAVPRHTQFGEFLGYIGSCVDITEQKQSEGVLRSSEERLRLVVRNMPVMMVGFDERHRIIVWNRECERVTGYRAEEVILNPKIMNLIAPQHEEREALLERWSRPVASYRDWEMSLFCRDGAVRTVAWSNISDELRVPGWATWAIGVDITDRRRAEEEHRRLQAQIQETQKYESLGVLAGGVAHDFNNILVGILGKASLARRELEASHPAAELIRQVEEASQVAAELTDQMLAYSGRGTFVVEPVDLSRLLSGMVHLLEVAVPQSTEVEFTFDDNLHAIEGDGTQMRQVAMNLVTNAGEAIGEEAGRIRVATREMEIDQAYLDALPLAEGCEPGNYCVLEVADNGCGMDPELAQKIFDPFFTTKFTGRGLGLAAVIGIVRGHRGAVRVETELGKGTTVTVLFPALDERVPAAEPKPTADLAEYHGDGTILVVDDEEAVRDVAGRMLEEFGFDVVTAESGATAIEEYRDRQNEIDGVLLDLTMPKMSGEQTLRALHEIRADLPVILSSGYSEHDAVRRLTTDPLASFLQKPYTADGLIQKVREVLEVHAPPRPIANGDAAPTSKASPADESAAAEDSNPVAR